MRLIGVVDLVAGRAVHACAGDREHYELVRNVAGSALQPGDAVALARTYLDRLGVTELYVADLDAILRGAAPHTAVAGVTALGAPTWLDSGVSSVERAQQALDAGASRIVVGLETLPSYEELRGISRAMGFDRVAFSLDLKDGDPVTTDRFVRGASPEVLAARAADAGASAVMVIDLARVGTGGGLDFELIARVRKRVPDVVLVAGGGVRGPEDLARLAACGCDAALVATALHSGQLAGWRAQD